MNDLLFPGLCAFVSLGDECIVHGLVIAHKQLIVHT